MRYIIDQEEKTIEILGSHTAEELEAVSKIYEGFKIKLTPSFTVKQAPGGIVVGAIYTPIIGNIDRN